MLGNSWGAVLDTRDWLNLPGQRQGRGLELGGLLGNGNPGDRSGTQVVQLPGWPLAQSVAPQFTWVPVECAAASQGW